MVEITRNNNNMFQVKISLDDLKENYLCKDDLMTTNKKQIEYINKIKQKIKNNYYLVSEPEEIYTFFIKNEFLILFKQIEKNYIFQSEEDFNNFFEYIKKTKFSDYIKYQNKKIQISSNSPKELFSILQEFTL